MTFTVQVVVSVESSHRVRVTLMTGEVARTVSMQLDGNLALRLEPELMNMVRAESDKLYKAVLAASEKRG